MLTPSDAQDRLEQLGAEKRRHKQAEHRREVERLLQHKRDLYEAARVSILVLCLCGAVVVCQAGCRAYAAEDTVSRRQAEHRR